MLDALELDAERDALVFLQAKPGEVIGMAFGIVGIGGLGAVTVGGLDAFAHLFVLEFDDIGEAITIRVFAIDTRVSKAESVRFIPTETHSAW